MKNANRHHTERAAETYLERGTTLSRGSSELEARRSSPRIHRWKRWRLPLVSMLAAVLGGAGCAASNDDDTLAESPATAGTDIEASLESSAAQAISIAGDPARDTASPASPCEGSVSPAAEEHLGASHDLWGCRGHGGCGRGGWGCGHSRGGWGHPHGGCGWSHPHGGCGCGGGHWRGGWGYPPGGWGYAGLGDGWDQSWQSGGYGTLGWGGVSSPWDAYAPCN
ncbi:Hypothetical protein A7982_09995 [Minicystis rosea]|nr:Hypothetical protein A7982_09995 [Minicystis rosea]